MARPPIESFILSPLQNKMRGSKGSDVWDMIWESLRGEDGDDGNDGVSVSSATINSEGHLILGLSDGKEIDAGSVRGENGLSPEVDYDLITKKFKKLIPEVNIPLVAEQVAALLPEQTVDVAAIVKTVQDSLEKKELLAEEIYEKLLASGKKFSPDFIEGLEELFEKTRKELRDENLKTIRQNIQQRGGPTQFLVKSNGVGVSRVDSINFTNATVTATGNGTNVDVTFSGGGGGTNIETPTGTVNGSNTAFSVSNTPVYINVDGLNRFSGVGYSYAGGTITIIDGAPPTQYIRSFY